MAERGFPPRPLEERFWPKVDRRGTDECWPWLGAITTKGYGEINARRVPVYAHRVAYELLIGPIPSGLQIDHLCRNRSCVNPAHMELVTSRENTLRGESPVAIHARKTHCLRGHEFDEDNTYRRPRGGRECRACQRLRREQAA